MCKSDDVLPICQWANRVLDYHTVKGHGCPQTSNMRSDIEIDSDVLSDGFCDVIVNDSA